MPWAAIRSASTDKLLTTPMAFTSALAVAALSKTHPSLYDYFRQRFAQVTNPPIDALREEVKTDCSIYVGDDGNLLSREAANSAVLELPSPVLTEEELQRIRKMEAFGTRWNISLTSATRPAVTISIS